LGDLSDKINQLHSEEIDDLSGDSQHNAFLNRKGYSASLDILDEYSTIRQT